MHDDELVVIYTVKDASEGEIIRNALEAEGIDCRLDGDNQGGLSGILDIRVLVRGADAIRARELMLTHEQHVGDMDDSLEEDDEEPPADEGQQVL